MPKIKSTKSESGNPGKARDAIKSRSLHKKMEKIRNELSEINGQKAYDRQAREEVRKADNYVKNRTSFGSGNEMIGSKGEKAQQRRANAAIDLAREKREATKGTKRKKYLKDL